MANKGVTHGGPKRPARAYTIAEIQAKAAHYPVAYLEVTKTGATLIGVDGQSIYREKL